MASHLHRYGSELARLEDIVDDLSKHLGKSAADNISTESPANHAQLGFEQVKSQLKAVIAFRHELESRTNNTLNLVPVQ